MDTKPNDGGPAFPEVFTDQPSSRNCNDHPDVYSAGGMSLRQYFAGQALAGMLAHPDTKFDETCDMIEQMRIGPWAIADAMLAADALLSQRSKGKAK